MQIIRYPHPALRWKSKPITRIDPELKRAVREMFDCMYASNGIGLAANQVALPFRLFIMNASGDPAIAEAVPGFTAVSWFGLFGPARLPPDVVTKINAEVRAIFADPKVRQDFLNAQYFEPIVGSSGELAERIRSEEPKWRKLIRDAHITVE